MNTAQQTKDLVRAKYAEIARQDKATNASSCCGAGGCSTEVYNIMTDDYTQVEGYTPDADLGLGCGLPTQFAGIKKGDTVLDLGSGAGNDCFVARHETGEDGRVIGVDFTPEMIAKAKDNATKLGYQNVEFRQGDIEALPLSACMVDVVVSNCVLNLVPDKRQALSEVLRVLKPGGHFSISDVVLVGELPPAIQGAAEMYAGCVSGALQESEYLDIIRDLGFEDITVQKRKPIVVPDDILSNYLNAEELATFKASGTGIFSITVFAKKSSVDCCAPKADKQALKDHTPADPEGVHALPGCDLGSGCC
ncbi:MAG TPA: arsenite methyltransferase [Flavobacteriales bacterium]|nr:arsenite methyltransferase [Flavobacteriales bacterium]HMR28183.1 arsenite methyltransferase [Flavobacteriales bacterium]